MWVGAFRLASGDRQAWLGVAAPGESNGGGDALRTAGACLFSWPWEWRAAGPSWREAKGDLLNLYPLRKGA